MLKESKLGGVWTKPITFEETPLDGIVGKEGTVQSLGASCLRSFLLGWGEQCGMKQSQGDHLSNSRSHNSYCSPPKWHCAPEAPFV